MTKATVVTKKLLTKQQILKYNTAIDMLVNGVIENPKQQMSEKGDITQRRLTLRQCAVQSLLILINVKKLNSLKQCLTATRPTSHN